MEENMFKKYYQQRVEEEKEELAKNDGLIKDFTKHAATLGIQLTDQNFQYIQTIGIVAIYPDIVSRLYPSLIKDKEGLLNFNELSNLFEKKRFANGYLYGETEMLMAHPYFRRGFHHSNNFAPRFIEFFWRLDDKNIVPYIALDFDRVRINVDNQMYMEFDTWYGAKFNKEINLIPDNLIKIQPTIGLDDFIIDFFFGNAFSLDIKWSTKRGVKNFQAEEFKTDKVKIIKNNIDYYPVRYIHAEFDSSGGYCTHFDGAIHYYTHDEYFARRDSDFNYNNKNASHIKSQSEKLFKLNGKISINTWIEFTSHFLTGNPLVFEYFEGEYPKHIKDVLEKITRK